jgi:hypothetical protein
MTGFARSPRLLKGGIVLIDPQSGAVRRIIALQYNPDSLSRTLQVQAAGGDSADRSQALRLKGPPVETWKVEAELDATDRLETADGTASQVGLLPQLAALETILYPTSGQLEANRGLMSAGTLEITPMETPLALFVWSKERVVPVRITEFSVTEEAFDPSLNPIRAKVSLGMRVLTMDDLTWDHRGASIFMAYLRNKEALAGRAANGSLGSLGLNGIP